PESCQTGGGVPKYGDYNGNTCAAGRLYSIWSSATSQPNAAPTAGIDVFFAQKLVCCAAQIQVSAPPPVTACAGTSASTTVNSGNFGNVCPAGQSNLVLQITNQSQCDLKVSSITSSDSTLFLPPSTASLPLTLTADATVDLPISFQPGASQSCSNSTPLT